MTDKTLYEILMGQKEESAKEQQIFSAEKIEMSKTSEKCSFSAGKVLFRGTDTDKARVLACIMEMLFIPRDTSAAMILAQATRMYLNSADKG